MQRVSARNPSPYNGWDTQGLCRKVGYGLTKMDFFESHDLNQWQLYTPFIGWLVIYIGLQLRITPVDDEDEFWSASKILLIVRRAWRGEEIDKHFDFKSCEADFAFVPQYLDFAFLFCLGRNATPFVEKHNFTLSVLIAMLHSKKQ